MRGGRAYCGAVERSVADRGALRLAIGTGSPQYGDMNTWRVTRKNVLGIKFACPECAQHMDAGRELFGEMVECPTCGHLMQAPDLKVAPADLKPKRLPRQTPRRP